jgi:cellulose synthase/poly-beta-1,6-N-acetylglucosamine synthase-like glycosyltransferase
MNSTLPRISVIVPVYNNEKIIAACLHALLEQDYPKDRYEVVVVDNNSTDKTKEIIQSMPVKYLLEKDNQTSYAARNKGVRETESEIVAFIDADCIADKNWISRGVAPFSDTKVGCVAGEVKNVAPTNDVESYICEKNVFIQMNQLNNSSLTHLLIGNAFIRRSIFQEIGYFETKWVSGGDADYGIRIQRETSYKMHYAADAIVHHKHRSTLKSMFKQNVKWGYGSTLLQMKYPELRKEFSLKQTVWKTYHFFSIGLRILPELVRYRPQQTKQSVFYDRISYLGWQIGLFYGSVRFFKFLF